MSFFLVSSHIIFVSKLCISYAKGIVKLLWVELHFIPPQKQKQKQKTLKS